MISFAELLDRHPPKLNPWIVLGVTRNYWRLIRCGMRPIVADRAKQLAETIGCSVRAMQQAHAETVRRLERKRARKAS